eukprot:CAMPEP_0176434616 /NCGR_PEP_ID=MMETSP0127-20121128/16794_1 /TAXON_ID=938130 /ORGANISM="Platyophrya macrostoma, Strain WH" /LENGTH=405 /DNA_ID=CAMNT_0017817409 /DNA_START=35 /DNA_END=1253 /DNA_ORIENTATION=-
MSWFKHDTDGPTEVAYRRENSQNSNVGGGSYFTDPQSYNENSRAVKNRSAMKNEFKNEYLVNQGIAERKREEKLEAKRFNAEKYMEQQDNERRLLDEKQDEKLRKLEKQKYYQSQLQQQMQDNFDRKNAQRAKENLDAQYYRSPFNSGAPTHQRDITNRQQLEALEQEKRTRKEKQDEYARQLSAQLQEQNEKKMYEKYQRSQPNPSSDNGDSLERLKRERDQYKRDYADALTDHVNVQNSNKQQLKEKERAEQQLTGLDIKGSYKFNGPTKEQFREELAAQILQKEQAKLREAGRDPYQREAAIKYVDEPADYGYYADPRVQENPYAGGGYQDDYNYQDYKPIIAGKSAGQKENAGGFDIFGNPTRQASSKPVKQGGDFDIFGNPLKGDEREEVTTPIERIDAA